MGSEKVSVGNEKIGFSFNAQTGSLLQIVDRTMGRDLLADPERGRLMRIVCPDQLWLSRFADSHDSGRPEVISSEHDIIIAWDHLTSASGDIEVKAKVKVFVDEERPEASFNLELQNNETSRLHEVRFPWVGGWKGIGGPGVDRAFCGCIPIDPHFRRKNFNYTLAGSHLRSFYCYNTSMLLPFFDISGDGLGIYYICFQERPNLGGMVVENLDREPEGLSLSWSWVHYPFVKPGSTWRSPAIRMGLHHRDWHATADRLREWLRTWWKAPPTPPDLANRIGFQTVQLRGFDGRPFHRFSEVPELAHSGLDFGVEDLCIWDPIMGVYLRPDDGDFLEEFDDSEDLSDLRLGLERAKAMGANVSTLVNLRLIRRNSSLYGKIGDKQVQRGVFNTPIAEEWSDCSYAHSSFRNKFLSKDGRALCQRSEEFRKRALEVVDRTMSLGFTSIFLDQAFDGNPCLSDDHGHRSPDDTHESALEWMGRASERVRRLFAESYVLGESTDVFGMQQIDISWNWSWTELAPEVIRYTLPETLHCWVVDRQAGVLGRAFAMGFLVAFTTHQAEKTLGDYPEFGLRVKQLTDMKRNCSDFHSKAEFRDTIGLEVADALGYVYSGAGGIGVCFIETTGQKRRVRASIDTAELGRRPEGTGALVFQDGSTVEIDEFDGKLVRIEFDIPAFEVALWKIPCY